MYPPFNYTRVLSGTPDEGLTSNKPDRRSNFSTGGIVNIILIKTSGKP